MKTKLWLFFLFLSFVIIIIWGKPSPWTWPNWLVAEHWEKWPEGIKAGYVTGFVHGELIGGKKAFDIISESKLFDENKIQPLWVKNADDGLLFKCTKVSCGQMKEGIDEFYRDYANRDIPVFMLLPFVCKRVKGEINQDSIEKELQKLRAESLKWKK